MDENKTMKIALIAIAKDEDNYINEWIDYNLKLGFDKIIIYMNDWDYVITNDKVITIPFNGKAMQMPAYNHFVQNNIEYDWAAFFDIDEFLVLKKHKNIHDFINDYKDYNGIAINWYLFGDNNLPKVFDNNYNVLSRFTRRESKLNHHIKSILKLDKTVTFHHPHNANKTTVSTDYKLINGPFNHNGNDDIAQINHYFCKTKEEYIKKRNRGRSDTGTYRNMSEFDTHNKNEVTDLTAYNFYYD